jgi:tetratricopeptide (TPR) repeat protein
MLNERVSFLSLLILIILCGCSVGTQIQGSYYLEQEKYSEGVEAFREKLKQHSYDPAANYYMGRYLLALNEPQKAYPYLKEAVALDFRNADYHFWLGVCYHGLNNLQKERESYHRAIGYDKRHIEAQLYLGHSYLEHDQWEQALNAYDRVLGLQEDYAQALYNRALALNQMNRIADEISAWKRYLYYYPQGQWALQAVGHLNARGNFDYRIFLIGDHDVILEKIHFEPASGSLLESSQPWLDLVGSIMNHDKKIHVKIVGYVAGDKKLAKRRSESVKIYIIRKFPDVNSERLKVSGIGKPENVRAAGKRFDLDDSINFMTIQN